MMMMKTAIFLTLFVCVSCSSPLPPDTPETRADTVRKITEKVETTPDATSTETTADGYKRALARRISEVNSIQVHADRPQALLRSVIVVKYSVDRNGGLLHSEIVRTNHDADTEKAALSTLRKTAPFPKPAPALLRNGRIEITETWLFNNDGRFQLRSIAQSQMGE
jgi:protein TonB